jgi:DNA-binding transcriptional MocR family regulator
LSFAEQFGFAIIEDDVYGDLHSGPAVRLAQIDGLRHVIYISSFTKLIGPALRVGYIAADPDMVARIIERKVLSVLSGSALLESFVAEVLDSGRYRKHLETLRSRLARMRRDAEQALGSAGITFENAGAEGIFLWGRLPESTPVDELVRGAREQSILLAKGTLFSPSKSSRQCLRFNVAHSTAPPLIRYLQGALKSAA